MSTERDTLVRISYPDQVSWLTVAERFRAWIIGGLWLLATVALPVRAADACCAAAAAPPPPTTEPESNAMSRCRRPIARLATCWSARRIITLAQLDEAVRLAERWNVRLGDAILSRNWIDPQALLRGLRAALTTCRSSI